MPNPIFQDNLQAIDQKTNDFQNFLSQFKSKPPRTYFTPNQYPQQNLSNQHFAPETESAHKNQTPSMYHEDFYESKTEFKHQFSPMDHSGQISEGSKGFQIRRPYKLNSSPPAKFSQQDNIKNQHPGQLIILRSAQELPHWLFDHIKKKNAPKLKNICIDQDKQRHSQIVASKDQIEEDRTKNKMAQRYLNQSFVARKQKELIYENAQNESSFVRSIQRKTSSQMENYRKMSSSSEMTNYQTSKRKQRVQKNQPVYINDYEYSYCPDPQAEDRKKNFRSANHKSAVFEQINQRKMQPSKKSRNSQYRIRQEQKPNKGQSVSKTPAKRLPTVSEQQPLVQPKKFALC